MFKWTIVTCLIVVPFVSCSDGSRPTDGLPDDPVSYHFEDGIRFRISERPPSVDSASVPKVVVDMRTEYQYPCCNFSIVHETHIASDEITLDLKGIYAPPICFTAIGPAGSSEVLDVTEGNYTLSFVDVSRRDTYDLVVTEAAIVVRPREVSFTESEYDLFWRPVPNSFAYLCGTLDSTVWICDDFLDTLLANLDLTELTFPDSGETPFPRSSYGHYYDAQGRYFIYGSDDDFVQAGSLLASYAKSVISHHMGTGITLLNWRGERYLSWLLDNP